MFFTDHKPDKIANHKGITKL